MSSINHEYKEWDEKNPQLTTCNQNTKNIMQGSTVPQEVGTDKEVVFTYDVSFKVLSCLALRLVLPYSCRCAILKWLLSQLLRFPPFRKVTSNGPRVGTLTFS